jgi:hypothetical protein
MHFNILAAISTLVLVSLAAAMPVRAQDSTPNYERFKEAVFLRYLNAHEGTGINEVPRIGLSFGGRVHRAVIDSGSTGIVVAARMIPNFEELPSLGEGRLTYSSSGRINIGKWVVTPVTLVGRNGAAVTTEPMPVLAVTQVRCMTHARRCTPRDAPRNIAMVGVGFARERDHQSQSTPEKNPLLRVASDGGERRRGYVLTAHGVHVGLTGANTRGNFQFVKLARDPSLPDWSPVPACISLNGQMPPACGTLLMDTGVSAMYITLPPSQAGSATGSLPPGTDVSIRIGTADSSSELYRFKVDGDSPLAPQGTHLRVSPTRVFVNTSYRFLNGFDLLYDADGGYVGFRARPIPVSQGD